MVAVTGTALIGWLVIIWGVWLLHTNTTAVARVGGGTKRVTSGVWSRIDNGRLLDLAGFIAGIVMGPVVVSFATGVAGGLLAGWTLSVFGLSATELGVAAVIAVVGAIILARGD